MRNPDVLVSKSEWLAHNVRPIVAAVAAIALALALRSIFDPVLGDNYRFTTLFGAVAIAVAYGGWQLGIFTAIIGYFGAGLLFIAVRGSPAASDIAGIGAYAFSCAVIIWLGNAMHKAERRATELIGQEQKRERFITSILESIHDCFYTVDREWSLTYVNPAAQAHFGKSGEELLGKSLWQALPGEPDEGLRQALVRGMRERVCVEAEGRSALTHHWIDLHAYPLADGLSVFFTDAQHRRDAEKAMAQASSRLQTLLNNTPLSVIEWSRDFRITRWSGTAQAMFGWAADEVTGRSRTDLPLFFEEDEEYVARTEQRLREPSNQFVISRNRNRTKAGRVIYCEWYHSVLEGPDGKMAAVLSLVLDVSERHRLEEQLQNSMRELKDADRRKDEFLATLAHELRNPLSPMKSSLEIMRLRPDDKALQERARDVMTRQVDMMVRLVDDLLDLSRITTGKLKLKRTKLEIMQVVRDAIIDAEPLIKRRVHDFDVRTPGAPLYVHGDATRLAQVVTNLLRNAAKFTDERGKISLSVDHAPGKVVIRVQDNGIGIPEDKLHAIFDMFAQAHTVRSRNSDDGLGIGLNIAKSIVEMHSGTIVARSAGPGKGSEFVVELPTAMECSEADSVATETRRPANRFRVLVADDNEDAANSIATLLQLEGHEVHAVGDGQSAWGLAEQIHPDVALLDLAMPGLTGYEVAQRIRQSTWGEDTLLVAVSGCAGEAETRKVGQAGFDSHFTKPVSLNQLNDVLFVGRSKRVDARPQVAFGGTGPIADAHPLGCH